MDPKIESFIVGGLHEDDFRWAVRAREHMGCILIDYAMDVDGYHWKATYVEADKLKKALRRRR